MPSLEQPPKGVVAGLEEAIELLSKQPTSGRPAKVRDEVVKLLKTLHSEAQKEQASQRTMKAPAEEAILDKLSEIQATIEKQIQATVEKQIQAAVKKLERKNNIEASGDAPENDAPKNDAPKSEVSKNDTPKNYADVLKSTATKANHQTERQKQKEALAQERASYQTVLSMKNMRPEAWKSLLAMTGREIAEHCQDEINSWEWKSKNGKILPKPHIIGVKKLPHHLHLHFETSYQALTANTLKDWGDAFEGLRLHEPVYGVVVRRAPIDSPTDDKALRSLEEENNLKTGTITKAAPLRSRKKQQVDENSDDHSLVLYLNDKHAANRCIANGVNIDFAHHATERFTPQFKATQCFNCYSHGHHASNCKRNPRCGKCSENHDTRECKNAVVKCCQCGGPHEAWQARCPVIIAEKKRLKELMGRTPCLFDSWEHELEED